MNTYTVRSYVKAIMNGSKFVYQTVPRMLTIWLDIGEDKRACQEDSFKKMTDIMAKAFKDAPVYKVGTRVSFVSWSIISYVVVYRLPSNSLTSRPRKSRSLSTSVSLDCHSNGGISSASSLAFHVSS